MQKMITVRRQRTHRRFRCEKLAKLSTLQEIV